MKITCSITSIIAALCLFFSAQGQIKQLRIGDKVPDIEMSEMVHYHKPSAKLSDFRGKAIIIDFWSITCSACLDAFPKIDSLQKRYKKDIAFIPVTPGTKQKIANTLKRIKFGEFELFTAVNDTLLKQYFPYYGLPQQVWIDKNGIVRSVNYGQGMQTEHLERLIAGKSINLPDHSLKTLDLKVTSGDQPLMIHEYQQYGVDNMLTYGYVSGEQKDFRGSSGLGNPVFAKGIRIRMLNRNWMSMLAAANHRSLSYNHHPSLVIRMDKSTLKGRDTRDISASVFCYDGASRDTSKLKAFDYMHYQLDLALNLKSSIQKQKVKCYVLKEFGNSRIYRVPKRISDSVYAGAKLEKGRYQIKNQLIDYMIRGFNERAIFDKPLFNETGHTGLKSFATFEFDFSEPRDIKRIAQSLHKYGLDLVEEERETDVVIIEDR